MSSSINWIGVIWLTLWACVFVGSVITAIVESVRTHRNTRRERKRHRRLRKRDRRALAARWWKLTVG